MKKTKTGQSKTRDLFELISDLKEDEVGAFVKSSRKKDGTPGYLEFFSYLRQHVEEGILKEQIFEDKIRIDVVERLKISENYQSLSRNLYRSLLAFLAEEYRKKETVDWRQKVTQGLDEVEALSSRMFFKQAAARLDQVEAMIPEQPERYVWNDLWPITRLGALKFWLQSQVDFLTLTKDQKTLHQLSRLVDYFRSDFRPKGEHHPFSLLRLEGEQMFIFRMINAMLIAKGDDRKRLKALNATIKSLESKNGLKGFLKHHSKDVPNAELKMKLLNVFIYRLALRKVGLLLDIGDLDAALKALERFQKSAEGELNLALVMMMSLQQQEIGLSRMIQIKSESSGFQKLEAEYFYSERLIEDMPIRMEFNSALIQAYIGNYDESLRRTKVLLKERAGRSARKSLIIELKLLEAVLEIQVADKRNDFNYESIRRINDAVKNHDGNSFEKLATRVIKVIGEWASDHHWQKLHLEKEQELVQQLKLAMNTSNPLHQFIIYWINLIQGSTVTMDDFLGFV